MNKFLMFAEKCSNEIVNQDEPLLPPNFRQKAAGRVTYARNVGPGTAQKSKSTLFAATPTQRAMRPLQKQTLILGYSLYEVSQKMWKKERKEDLLLVEVYLCC